MATNTKPKCLYKESTLISQIYKNRKPDVTDNDTDVTENVTENGTDVTENVTDISTAKKRREEMLRLMTLDKKITTGNLANILHVSRRTIARDINLLRSQNRLMRDGDDYGGSWVVM